MGQHIIPKKNKKLLGNVISCTNLPIQINTDMKNAQRSTLNAQKHQKLSRFWLVSSAHLFKLLLIPWLAFMPAKGNSQGCQVEFWNGIDCSFDFSIYLDCPGMTNQVLAGNAVQGTWDSASITSFTSVSSDFCGSICLDPASPNCWRVTINGNTYIPEIAPGLNPTSQLVCCNPPNPNNCIQDNCGQLTIECDHNNNKIIIKLKKPNECL